ncbi:MAG: hypothetical protein E6Q97_32920 [Desulfurellales bacterium]|jgi:hypothetical protein|nr:MAG: hypothetical protein E6Q97_32920 [Desulfurellales bacterium]
MSLNLSYTCITKPCVLNLRFVKRENDGKTQRILQMRIQRTLMNTSPDEIFVDGVRLLPGEEAPFYDWVDVPLEENP